MQDLFQCLHTVQASSGQWRLAWLCNYCKLLSAIEYGSPLIILHRSTHHNLWLVHFINLAYRRSCKYHPHRQGPGSETSLDTGFLLCYIRGGTLFPHRFLDGLHRYRSLEGPLFERIQAQHEPADTHVANN